MTTGIKTGGRAKGTRNKATIELERRALEELAQNARRAERGTLAKDELEALIPEVKELLAMVKTAVAQFQRAAILEGAGEPGKPAFDSAAWDRLKAWMELYAEVMLKAASIEHKAADFQSPKFKAIAVVAPQGQPMRTVGEKTDDRYANDPNAAMRTYLRLVKGEPMA